MGSHRDLLKPGSTANVMYDVLVERGAQDKKWGEQNHPDGTNWSYEIEAEHFRALCDREAEAGRVTWRHILLEEVYEALSEESSLRLRDEQIQVAAVAAAWVEAIDRRAA